MDGGGLALVAEVVPVLGEGSVVARQQRREAREVAEVGEPGEGVTDPRRGEQRLVLGVAEARGQAEVVCEAGVVEGGGPRPGPALRRGRAQLHLGEERGQRGQRAQRHHRVRLGGGAAAAAAGRVAAALGVAGVRVRLHHHGDDADTRLLLRGHTAVAGGDGDGYDPLHPLPPVTVTGVTIVTVTASALPGQHTWTDTDQLTAGAGAGESCGVATAQHRRPGHRGGRAQAGAEVRAEAGAHHLLGLLQQPRPLPRQPRQGGLGGGGV